jgi:hypothetical protein
VFNWAHSIVAVVVGEGGDVRERFLRDVSVYLFENGEKQTKD